MYPVLSERPQSIERLEILPAVGGNFARNYVVDVANREPFDFHVAFPGIGESLYAIGGENKVHVKRTILELHKILAIDNLCRLFLR